MFRWIVTLVSLIQSKITLASTANWDGFLLRFSSGLLTSKYANIVQWMLPFYRNKSKSCLYLNVASSGNDNQLVESTLFIQQRTSATMEMSPNKASNVITSATTGTNNIYKSRTKGLFSVHISDNKQAPTARSNKHASTTVTMILPEDLPAKNQHKALWAPQQQ